LADDIPAALRQTKATARWRSSHLRARLIGQHPEFAQRILGIEIAVDIGPGHRLAHGRNADCDVIQVPGGTYAQPRGTLVINNPAQLRGSTSTPTIVDGDGVQPLFNVAGSPTVLFANVSSS